jgi:predicted membrane chloride channel (bestrophin family)
MNRKRHAAAIFLILTLLTIGFWLSIGYYHSYIDHEDSVIYFVKKRPTLRREFVNPFANEGNPLPFNELSPDIQKELSDYCKYAYGITHTDAKTLENCRERIVREVQ